MARILPDQAAKFLQCRGSRRGTSGTGPVQPLGAGRASSRRDADRGGGTRAPPNDGLELSNIVGCVAGWRSDGKGIVFTRTVAGTLISSSSRVSGRRCAQKETRAPSLTRRGACQEVSLPYSALGGFVNGGFWLPSGSSLYV